MVLLATRESPSSRVRDPAPHDRALHIDPAPRGPAACGTGSLTRSILSGPASPVPLQKQTAEARDLPPTLFAQRVQQVKIAEKPLREDAHDGDERRQHSSIQRLCRNSAQAPESGTVRPAGDRHPRETASTHLSKRTTGAKFSVVDSFGRHPEYASSGDNSIRQGTRPHCCGDRFPAPWP